MSIQNLNSFGMTYVGVRTKHVHQMKQFAEQVLGYEKTHDDGDFVAFTTPQGQRFELHAEDDANGTRWAHFRGPDGNIYEFVHHPSLLNGGMPE